MTDAKYLFGRLFIRQRSTLCRANLRDLVRDLKPYVTKVVVADPRKNALAEIRQ